MKQTKKEMTEREEMMAERDMSIEYAKDHPRAAEREKAAMKIQARMRGKKARQEIDVKKNERMAKLEAIRAKKAGKAAGGDDDDGPYSKSQGKAKVPPVTIDSAPASPDFGAAVQDISDRLKNAAKLGMLFMSGGGDGGESSELGEARPLPGGLGAAKPLPPAPKKPESPPPPPSALRRQSTGHLRSADATAKLAAIQARKNSRKNLVKDADEFGETEAMAKAIDKYNYSATRQVI